MSGTGNRCWVSAKSDLLLYIQEGDIPFFILKKIVFKMKGMGYPSLRRRILRMCPDV